MATAASRPSSSDRSTAPGRLDVVEAPIVAGCNMNPEPVGDVRPCCPIPPDRDRRSSRAGSAVAAAAAPCTSSMGLSSEPTVMPVRSSRTSEGLIEDSPPQAASSEAAARMGRTDPGEKRAHHLALYPVRELQPVMRRAGRSYTFSNDRPIAVCLPIFSACLPPRPSPTARPARRSRPPITSSSARPSTSSTCTAASQLLGLVQGRIGAGAGRPEGA